MKINKLMDEAKVTEVMNLVGVPVECDFGANGNVLKSFRVLTEVL